MGAERTPFCGSLVPDLSLSFPICVSFLYFLPACWIHAPPSSAQPCVFPLLWDLNGQSSQDSSKDRQAETTDSFQWRTLIQKLFPTQLSTACLDIPLESESLHFSVEGRSSACDCAHSPHNSGNHWIIPRRKTCSRSAEGSRSPWKSRFAQGLGWTVNVL